MASITVRPEVGSKIFESRFFRPQSSEFEPFRKKPSVFCGTSVWKFLSSRASASGMTALLFGVPGFGKYRIAPRISTARRCVPRGLRIACRLGARAAQRAESVSEQVGEDQ